MNKKPFIKKDSPYELISIYKPTQKLLKDLLNEEYSKLDKIKQTEENIITATNKTKLSYQEKEDGKWLLLGVYVELPRKEINKKIEEYKKLISILKYNNQKGSGNNIRLDVERAKSIPISDYIDFDRSHRAVCLWHEDNNPSLYYDRKRNRVHCFSCGQGGDTIDVVMKLFNKDFVGAVKMILNN